MPRIGNGVSRAVIPSPEKAIKIFSKRFGKMTIYDLAGNLKNKVVLVRINIDGLTEKRIDASMPTIKFLVSEGAKVVLLSHNGRPKGKTVQKLTLEPAALKLTVELYLANVYTPGQVIKFVNALTGDKVKEAASEMKPGDVLLLENTRFSPREQSTDKASELAREIIRSTGAKIAVIDGVGVAHRKDASVTRIATEVKTNKGIAVAGNLLATEIGTLQELLFTNPNPPIVALLGGVSVNRKVETIKQLASNPKVKKIVIGGPMIYPFLRALGYKNIGEDPIKGKREKHGGGSRKDIKDARGILKKWNDKEQGKDKIFVPTVVIAAEKGAAKGKGNVIDLDLENVPASWVIKDISGVDLFLKLEEIDSKIEAEIVVWNGPFGDLGTKATVDWLTDRTKHGITTIVFGDDTDKATDKAKEEAEKEPEISYELTGGRAIRRFIEERSLPAIEVLSERKKQKKEVDS